MANSDMHVSHVGLELVKKKEGTGGAKYRIVRDGVLYVLPYHGALDEPDIWTIGYGTTFNVRDFYKWKNGITLDHAEELLKKRVAEDFEPKIKSKIVVPLNQHQFDALVSLVYNCGPGAVYGDIGTAVNAKKFYEAVKLIATLYVKTDADGAGPKPKLVTDGLVRRRLTEAWLFHTGELFNTDTPQKRDVLLRRLVDRKLINPDPKGDDAHIFPDYGKYPKTGYPA